VTAFSHRSNAAMNIEVFSGTAFGGGDGDLRPGGAASAILRLIIGAGCLVWALAIWKAVELLLS